MRVSLLRYAVLLLALCVVTGCLHHSAPDVQYPLTTLFCQPCPAAPFIAPSVEPAAKPVASEEMPIDFNTALHLADQNSPTIAVVRERIQEAVARQQAAQSRWLPDLDVGPIYTLHDGP